jgi:Cu+-exporting ATPase
MGLATPAAIMAAANTAAKRGILIRDGVALEKAGAVTAVLFDKTGTLTEGKPVVADAWFKAGGDENQVRELACALAKDSTHPISQAVAAWRGGDSAERRQSNEAQLAALSRDAATGWTSWREVRGSGIEARDQAARTMRLGSQNWLRQSSVTLDAGEDFATEWSGKGATVIGLAADAELLALFAVQDALKPGAARVVKQLRTTGLKTYLITGDNPRTAQGIAAAAGIAEGNVFAEVRPEQKAEFVKKLQAQGEKVAFVGDGINDAPALEQADLGIAVSRASDVAREAADIILLKSDIEAVPESIGLARASLRTIKQNLFWAFFYNAAAVPLAVLGFMSPVLCAAAMGASDIVVIGNALRLRRWRQKG